MTDGPIKQFNTLDEVIRALKPGTTYYRCFAGTMSAPRKVIDLTPKTVAGGKRVMSIDYETKSLLWKMFDFEYAEDLQSTSNKAVFTDKKMAEAFSKWFK